LPPEATFPLRELSTTRTREPRRTSSSRRALIFVVAIWPELAAATTTPPFDSLQTPILMNCSVDRLKGT